MISQKETVLKADRLFSEKKYSESLVLYDKIYAKKKDRNLLLKIADANYLNENFSTAQKTYASYFRDTVYENITQFGYYANSCRLSGKLLLARDLYQKLYDRVRNDSVKNLLEVCKLFVDSAKLVPSCNLDSSFNCITIDASESRDTLSPPISYSWNFDDGKTDEGLKVEHCFEKEGVHSVVLNTTDLKTGIVRERDTTLLIELKKLPVKFNAKSIAKRHFNVDFSLGEIDLNDYNILDCFWDMGDGFVGTGKKLTYKYDFSGEYTVRLALVAQNKLNGKKRLFSANKKITIVENYRDPNDKFPEVLNGAK